MSVPRSSRPGERGGAREVLSDTVWCFGASATSIIGAGAGAPAVLSAILALSAIFFAIAAVFEAFGGVRGLFDD